MPQGPDMRLYGRCDYGALASFFILDARQYRSRLACDHPPKGGGKQITDTGCPERLEPNRSNLGVAQENWLYDQFRAAPAKWNIVTQEQLIAEFKERIDNGDFAHWSEDWNGGRPSSPRSSSAPRSCRPGRLTIGSRRGSLTTRMSVFSTAGSAAMSVSICGRNAWRLLPRDFKLGGPQRGVDDIAALRRRRRQARPGHPLGPRPIRGFAADWGNHDRVSESATGLRKDGHLQLKIAQRIRGRRSRLPPLLKS